MYIQQIYTNCLAQAAYYIESAGEAAIVDPLRNPEPYIALAKERGAVIKYVLETHFHADFVSGHIDLANKTGAVIVFGPDANPAYKAFIAKDGELLALGNMHIEILHTPGHTIESTCYLLRDKTGKAESIFTGDTLFIGDVGRPDLLSGNLSKEELAAIMFDSLKNKIKPLADDIVVFPGHGAGSACGKNISTDSQSTIGKEKLFNYALKLTEKDDFIKAITTDQPVIPGYFFSDATINKTGCANFDEVLEKGMKGLTVDGFKELQLNGAVVVDTRSATNFAGGFIPGALNIGLTGDFAVWVGTFVKPGAALLLVTEPGKEHEAVERLARIGYDNVLGHLESGMAAWFAAKQECGNIPIVDSIDLQDAFAGGAYELLDVRNRREVAKDRIAGSVHIPLNQLADAYTTLDIKGNWLIYCAGGYRSMIAASFLAAKGYHFVASVDGGINRIKVNRPELVELGMETE